MSKLTPWFPANVKPVRVGVYRVQYYNYSGFAYWDGKQWSNLVDSVASAYKNHDWTDGAIQQKRWRGLTQEAA